MKKIIPTLISLCICLPTIAYDFEYTYEGQTLKYTVSGDNCFVAAGTNWAPAVGDTTYPDLIWAKAGNDVNGALIIPEQAFDGTKYYNVTKIRGAAFANLYGLTSVRIPQTVTQIERGAFYRCRQLKEIVIQNANKISFDSYAFSYCSALTGIVFQNTTTYGIVPENNFTGCGNIRKVVKPSEIKYDFAKVAPGVYVINYQKDDVYFRSNGFVFNNDQSQLLYVPVLFEGDYSIRTNTTAIGPAAFAGCSGMTSVTIPQSVTTIGNSAFGDCSGLESVEIPASISEIGDSVFINCSGMKTVTIPNTIATIGKSAFSGCQSLTSVTIPESVISIDTDAFSGCGVLATLKLGEKVESIGESAFSGCSSLTSLSVPHSVSTIGDNAFYDCSGLTTIRLTDGITSLGNNVWMKCKAVKDVEYMAENPIEASNTIFDPVAYDEAALHVPTGAVNTYMSAVPWNYFIEITDKAIPSSIYDITEDSATDIIDYSAPYYVYDMHGVHVADSIEAVAPGFYIIRQGAKAIKIIR